MNFDGLLVFSFEVGIVSQKARHQKIKDGPQLGETIFEGGPREGPLF